MSYNLVPEKNAALLCSALSLISLSLSMFFFSLLSIIFSTGWNRAAWFWCCCFLPGSDFQALLPSEQYSIRKSGMTGPEFLWPGWLVVNWNILFIKNILELHFCNISSLSLKCYSRTGAWTFCIRNTYFYISCTQWYIKSVFLRLGEEDTKPLSHTANNGKQYSSI